MNDRDANLRHQSRSCVTSSLNAAGHLRVYINDILHLSIDTKRLIEVQSWKMTTRSPPMFVIERTYEGGTVQVSDYDDRELWKRVLNKIDEAHGHAPSTPNDEA